MHNINRSREDEYFLRLEKQRLEKMRRNSAREAETVQLMEAFGIRPKELVRQLLDAGFNSDTFRVLYLVPLIQTAWSDGSVSERERQQILQIANLRGIAAGSGAYERLVTWLTERPQDQFFELCLRGVRAMLQHRPPSEAKALHRDLVWYCTRVASASGGLLGMGSRISRQEKQMLLQIGKDLELNHPAAAGQVTKALGR